MVRLSALTMPAVSVPWRPNGLPMAARSWPTCTLLELPHVSGCSCEASTLTLITAMSVDSSVPTSVAFTVLPVWQRTLIELSPSTTCAFVTMSPFVSMTKPEPSACEDVRVRDDVAVRVDDEAEAFRLRGAAAGAERRRRRRSLGHGDVDDAGD